MVRNKVMEKERRSKRSKICGKGGDLKHFQTPTASPLTTKFLVSAKFKIGL
jgi:hypothetical protein